MANRFRLTKHNTIILEFNGFSLEIPAASGIAQAPKDPSTSATGTLSGKSPDKSDSVAPNSSSANPTVDGDAQIGRPPLDPGIIGFVHKEGTDLRKAPGGLLTLSDGTFDVGLAEFRSADVEKIMKLAREAQARRGFSRAKPFYLDVGMQADQSEQLEILRSLGSIVMNTGNSIAGIRLIRSPRE